MRDVVTDKSTPSPSRDACAAQQTLCRKFDPTMLTTKRTPTLSKSRIQSGRQCEKRLWLELNRRDAIEWGAAAQQRLDEGTRFGELAQELLGGAGAELYATKRPYSLRSVSLSTVISTSDLGPSRFTLTCSNPGTCLLYTSDAADE